MIGKTDQQKINDTFQLMINTLKQINRAMGVRTFGSSGDQQRTLKR